MAQLVICPRTSLERKRRENENLDGSRTYVSAVVVLTIECSVSAVVVSWTSLCGVCISLVDGSRRQRWKGWKMEDGRCDVVGEEEEEEDVEEEGDCCYGCQGGNDGWEK